MQAQKPNTQKITIDPISKEYHSKVGKIHWEKMRMLSYYSGEKELNALQKLFAKLRQEGTLESILQVVEQKVVEENFDLNSVKFKWDLKRNPKEKKVKQPKKEVVVQHQVGLNLEQVLKNLTRTKEFVESVGGIHNAYLLLDYMKKI